MTTTDTVAPVVTIEDVRQVAGDLTARPDITFYSLNLTASEVGGMVEDARSLQAMRSLLDGPITVRTMDTNNEDGVIVTMIGRYRGVSARFFTSFYAGADLDLIRSFVEPSVAMIDALAGDAPVDPEAAGGAS